MPSIKKLFQKSENSAKPVYIHSHMFGGIGLLARNPGDWAGKQKKAFQEKRAGFLVVFYKGRHYNITNDTGGHAIKYKKRNNCSPGISEEPFPVAEKHRRTLHET